jgi:hypothetical protein
MAGKSGGDKTPKVGKGVPKDMVPKERGNTGKDTKSGNKKATGHKKVGGTSEPDSPGLR